MKIPFFEEITYYSALEPPEIFSYYFLEKKKEKIGFLIEYCPNKVRIEPPVFEYQRIERGKNANLYPKFNGIVEKDFNQKTIIQLKVRLSYMIFFLLLFPIPFFTIGFLGTEEMKINGVMKMLYFLEKSFFSLFLLIICLGLIYFKSILPYYKSIKNIEKELKLTKKSSPY